MGGRLILFCDHGLPRRLWLIYRAQRVVEAFYDSPWPRDDPVHHFGPRYLHGAFEQQGFRGAFATLSRTCADACYYPFANCALTPSPTISCLQVAKKLSTKALDSDEPRFEQALRFLYDVVAPFLVVFFFLLLGTLFEVLYNRWNWVDALFFAFFSISSCGQTPPGSVDDAELLFVSVYLLTGIPLFGNAIGRLANFIMMKFLRIEKE